MYYFFTYTALGVCTMRNVAQLSISKQTKVKTFLLHTILVVFSFAVLTTLVSHCWECMVYLKFPFTVSMVTRYHISNMPTILKDIHIIITIITIIIIIIVASCIALISVTQ